MFTLNADGAAKTVSVVALGMEDPELTADSAIKQAMAALGNRLRDFDAGGSLAEHAVRADRLPGRAPGAAGPRGRRDPRLAVDRPHARRLHVPERPERAPAGTATLTPEQAAALGVEGFENGIAAGIWLRDDAGKVYSLVIRPLLPDEALGVRRLAAVS